MFSDADRIKIATMWNEGKTSTQIAQALGGLVGPPDVTHCITAMRRAGVKLAYRTMPIQTHEINARLDAQSAAPTQNAAQNRPVEQAPTTPQKAQNQAQIKDQQDLRRLVDVVFSER